MVTEPESELDEMQEAARRARSGMPGYVKWIIIFSVFIVQAVLIYFGMTSCSYIGDDSGTFVPPPGYTGMGTSIGMPNPTIDLIPRVIANLKTTGNEHQKYLTFKISLEVTHKSRLKELTKCIENMKPWIEHMLLEKAMDMSSKALSGLEGKRELQKKILDNINARLGAWRGNPQLKSVFMPEYNLQTGG